MSVVLRVAVVGLLVSSCLCDLAHYCNIFNEYHHPFYMYATSRFFSVSAVSRSVYLWSQFVKKKTGDGGNSVISFGSSGDDQSVWRLEPVANRSGCYRIRNVKYDELLYRSTFLSSGVVPLLPVRSYVYTWSEWVFGGRASVVSADDEAFMWTLRQAFEPAKSQSHQADKMALNRGRKATIWTVKFDEPLYVPMFGGNGILASRVYTWSGRPDSTLFNWILTCAHDDE